MTTNIYQPSPPLKDYIHYYWGMESDSSNNSASCFVYPLGTPELFFHYRNPFHVYINDGVSYRQPQSFLCCQKLNSVNVAASGDTGMIAVAFKPFGASFFFDFSLKDHQNEKIDLCDIFGDRHKRILEMLSEINPIRKKIEIVESFLISRLNSNYRDVEILKRGIEAININHGKISIEEAARCSYVSYRHFERLFLKRVGLSLKQYSAIKKINLALNMMKVMPCTNLTEIALDAGFYDQSHFIRNFKSILNITPSQYAKIVCSD